MINSLIRFFHYDRPEFVRAVLLFDRLKLNLAHQFYSLTYLPLIEVTVAPNLSQISSYRFTV